MDQNILVIAEKAPRYDGGGGTQKLLFTTYCGMPNVHFLIFNDENKNTYLDNWTAFCDIGKEEPSKHKTWRYENFVRSFSTRQDRFVKSESIITQLSETIQAIIIEKDIKLLIFEQSGVLMWSWWKCIPDSVKCVLRVHDSHYLYFLADIKTRKKSLSKLALLGSAFAQKQYEKKEIQGWDQIQFVSQNELEFYRTEYPREEEKFLYTPSSIIYEGNKYLENPVKNTDILFVGTMTWKPNTDAVHWFLEKVLPMITQELPEVKVKIVGKDADKRIFYKGNNVEILGFVESLDGIYKDTYLAINPSQSGGGVKVKLMEYASYGIPIVSTSNGISGFCSDIEQDICVHNAPEDIAKAIIKLLRYDCLRIEYSHKIFAYTEKHFDIRSNQIIWEKEINKLI